LDLLVRLGKRVCVIVQADPRFPRFPRDVADFVLAQSAVKLVGIMRGQAFGKKA
jgi:hypothetical protein